MNMLDAAAALDTTFAALADPTRRGILELLADGERSVGEIVDAFALSQSAISRHLNVLEQAALVSRRRDGQRRLCALNAQPLAELESWAQRHRARWQSRLDRLDAVLKQRKTPC